MRQKQLFVLILGAAALFNSCKKAPLFNLVGQEEYPAHRFIVRTVISLEKIEKVGSVYGTPLPGSNIPASPDNPAGAHNGIDIIADEGTPVVAALPGVVVWLKEHHIGTLVTRQVKIRYNHEYSLLYTLEPAREIKVGLYESVAEGTIIGYLGRWDALGGNGQLHFGVERNGQWTCPAPYLSPELRRKLNQAHRGMCAHSGCPVNLCNHPQHQHLFD